MPNMVESLDRTMILINLMELLFTMEFRNLTKKKKIFATRDPGPYSATVPPHLTPHPSPHYPGRALLYRDLNVEGQGIGRGGGFKLLLH